MVRAQNLARKNNNRHGAAFARGNLSDSMRNCRGTKLCMISFDTNIQLVVFSAGYSGYSFPICLFRHCWSLGSTWTSHTFTSAIIDPQSCWLHVDLIPCGYFSVTMEKLPFLPNMFKRKIMVNNLQMCHFAWFC